MLDLARDASTASTSCTTTASTPARGDGHTVDVPLVTTLHTPPVPWLESAVALSPASSSFAAVSELPRAPGPTWPGGAVLNGVDVDRWTPGPAAGPRCGRAGWWPRRRPTRPSTPAGWPASRWCSPARARRGLLRARDRPAPGSPGGARGPPRPQGAHPPARPGLGRAGHPRLGRALRPGRRRGDGLRHPRGGLRPRRAARGRRRRGRRPRPGGRRRGARRRGHRRARARPGRGVRRHAVQHCSLRRMVDEYERLYRSLGRLQDAA